jgi:hypothetical protein
VSSSSPCRVKNFLHPASYPVGTGSLPGGVNRSWREADYSPPTRAEVKKSWVYTFTPPLRLHGVVLNSLRTGIILFFNSLLLNSLSWGIRVFIQCCLTCLTSSVCPLSNPGNGPLPGATQRASGTWSSHNTRLPFPVVGLSLMRIPNCYLYKL